MNDSKHLSNFRPKLSEIIQIDVASNEKLDQVYYQVIGNGDVILSEEIVLPGTKNFQIVFKPTIAMVPKASVIVFYITKDGEIISDLATIEFGNDLKNFVS